MLSSLSSYIWGSSEEEQQQQPGAAEPQDAGRSPSPVPEDDWVMVGKSPGNNLHLGSLVPGTPTLPSSLPSSSSASEADEQEPNDAASSAAEDAGGPAAVVRRQPRPQAAVQQLSHGALTPASAKGVRSAQLSRQRNSGKALSSKALKRNNAAVMTGGGKKSLARQNISIKMAGANKNLKQC